MSAVFSEIAVGLARYPRLGFSHGLDDDLYFLDEIVEAPAGDRIATSVNHERGFDEVGCRKVTDITLFNWEQAS